VSIALFATAAFTSPALADCRGAACSSSSAGGVSTIAIGHGPTVSGLVPATPAQSTGTAASGAATVQGPAVSQAAQGLQGSGSNTVSGSNTGSAGGSGGPDASSPSSEATSGGGVSETARGHGADVSTLARATDGARGSAVSAFANTQGDVVSAEARLNSGSADNDADESSPALDPAGIQLTA